MNPTQAYVGRFAPSPTGPLHFGSLVAAMASYLDARHHDGTWLLRIEDVDEIRASATAERAILSALDCFGLHWDGVPIRQSARKDRYAAALAQLQTGGHSYPCGCTRSEIATLAHNGIEGPVYPGTCRNGSRHPHRPQAIRVFTDATPIEIHDRIAGRIVQRIATEIGDFVIRRSDGYFAYQLAVVVDDAEQGVNQVVRGADLLLSTPRQIFLQHLLGYPQPGYAHVPLVLDEQRRKLSKQDGACPIDPRDPLPALRAGWCFLRQPEPRDWPQTVDEFWLWAVKSWNIDLIQTQAQTQSA